MASTTEERARELAGDVTRCAERTERERQVPGELLKDLAASGCLRMAAPREHGGDELPLPDVLGVVAELARADGAVGWTVGQAAMAQVVLSRFPRETIDTVYAAGCDVVGAGAAAPKGKARKAEHAWRVSGRWPFATGIGHASWFYGQCVAFGPGVPEGSGGVPATRMALLWPAEYTVLDTWNATGLCGTGSHDVVAHRLDCPAERTAVLSGSSPTLDRPAYRVPAVEYSGMVVAASGVGIAAGAVEDVLELATGGRRPSFSPRKLADSPVFQDRVGAALLEAEAARALLHRLAGLLHAHAGKGTVPSVEERALVRGGCHHIAAAVTRVVDTAHTLAGSSGVYIGAPIERRLRDVHTLTQHATTARESVKVLGATRVGEIDPSLTW
ncbi:acyl-CoA dehydrogenase family protein [Qaidamihabitans albus]|uniref:acyl-CoA dehydrogenase family protein n=1 Tax=Qaidamihabitans albus TaxID=2795733 RepID=UPI0018F1E467|nr:acyl-CoA dehydrogenase family protein [Qaidamihabitans albus]